MSEAYNKMYCSKREQLKSNAPSREASPAPTSRPNSAPSIPQSRPNSPPPVPNTPEPVSIPIPIPVQHKKKLICMDQLNDLKLDMLLSVAQQSDRNIKMVEKILDDHKKHLEETQIEDLKKLCLEVISKYEDGISDVKLSLNNLKQRINDNEDLLP